MKVLRWIAVLPAAIFGGILLAMVFRFLFRLFNPVTEYGIMGIIDEAIYNATMGACFVYVGSYVAPEYKKQTSIVLTTLVVVLSVVSLGLQLFYIRIIDWIVIIGCVFLAIGGIGSSFHIHDNKEEFEL